jgi:hypothetical protein
MVQRLYQRMYFSLAERYSSVPLRRTFVKRSKYKFKTIVLFECLEIFYWLLRLSEIDF